MGGGDKDGLPSLLRLRNAYATHARADPLMPGRLLGEWSESASAQEPRLPIPPVVILTGCGVVRLLKSCACSRQCIARDPGGQGG